MVPAAMSVSPVGRVEELAALRAPIDAVVAGRGGTVWIEGEPGIGKSVLVVATLAEAAARGCLVYRAGGDELRWRLPFRALVDGLGPEVAAEVAAVLRSSGQGIASYDAVPAAMERLLAVVDRLCARSPVVLALDDLQWADEASLQAWHRMGSAVDQLPLLLVSACRPVPARAMTARLRQAAQERASAVISLGPLSSADAASLAADMVGAAPGPRLTAALAAAAGNPLYIRELVEALRRERRVRVEGGVAELVGAADEAPSGLAGAIRARLGFLSPGTASTLQIAALLGHDFSMADLTTVVGKPGSAIRPVLEEAVAAGVVAESGERVEFRHDLIRQALYEATPASARSALHRQVARAFADAGLPVDRVAAHLVMAPDAIDGWAVDWLAARAEELAYRAPELAAEVLPMAAETDVADGVRRQELLRCLARALFLLNRLDEAEAVARSVLAGTTEPDRAAEMAWVLGWILNRAGRYLDTLAVIEEALARPGLPPLWHGRLRAWRARALPAVGRRAEAEAEARRALAEGEKLADALAVGHSLQMLYMLADFEIGLSHVDRALDVIGDAPALASLRIILLTNRASSLDTLGRTEVAETSMREALMLAERIGTWGLPTVRVQLASLQIDRGRWDDALAELTPLTGSLGLFEQLLRLGGMSFIAAHRDDRAMVRKLLRQADALPELRGYMRGNARLLWMAQAVDAEQRGGASAAAAVLAGTVGVADGPELFERHLWLPDLVRIAQAAGDAELARAAVATAEADCEAEPLPRRVAAARRARAMLDGDSAALLRTVDDYGALRAPLELAQTFEDAAALLAKAGDLGGAKAALSDAIDGYVDLGAAWDIRRADARLRALGVRRGVRTRQRKTKSGWDALTPTESRVAAMVAQGRSNPDIAAEMLLSRRTVQTHVSSILAKLGASSRVEIARAAGRESDTAVGG